MTFVTLIGERMAKEGKEFIYLGIGGECKNCRLKTICSNLKKGRKYRITKVREKHHECKIHDGGVRAVEIEEMSIIAAVPSELAEGTVANFRAIECKNIGCENFHYCHLLIKEKKYRIEEVIEDIECPKGFDLKKVVLAD